MARGGQQVTGWLAAALIATPHAAWAETNAERLAQDRPIATAPQQVPASRINTTQRPIELVVPVRERGPLGQASVIIGVDDAIRVRAQDLIGLLSRIVTPEAVAQLNQVTDADGYISPEAARSVGFDLVFDPGLLDIAVTLPLEARQRQTLGLGFDATALNPPVTHEPEPFAVYLNYRASMDYLHSDTAARDRGFQAPRFDLELNGTVGQVAFQNYLTVDPDTDDAFQRSASRLIYDQPGRAMRWTLGDLVPEGVSFQNASDIAGLSVARLYSLTPNDRLLTSRSSRTVTLREPSTVEIRVNGAVARTLTLQPGTYDLRDLPLTQGANAVEIVVEGPSGAREVIAFDFFSDTTLLAPGIDEFYFAVGIQAPREAGGIDYQSDEPVLSGFYRRGINEQLTAGANLQAIRDAALIGGELVYGGPWGLTAFELSASQRENGGSGVAARAEHRMFRELTTLPGRETLDLSLELRSRDFAPIDSIGRFNSYPLQAAVRYSRPLSRTISASVGADYAMGRDLLDDRYGVSAFGSWRVDYDTNLTFGANYNSNAFAGEETNVFVNLTRRFGARTSVSAGLESRNGLVRAGFSRAPERALNDWAYSADISRTDDAVGLNAAAIFLANRAELEFNHATVFDQDGDIGTQQTSARAYGSIAYAGGRVGVGRRLYDSFALVSPHPSLGRRPVLIRGVSALEESARSGRLGPAVAPLGSYYPQSVPYDVEDLPLGYDLGSGLFQLQPRLHSGYALTVGSAFNTTATGLMLDARGEPVSLRSGRAVSLDDPDAPQTEVITNRSGRFAVAGLSAGRWRITLSGEPALIYDIVVPDTTLFRAGELRPSSGG